MNDKLARAKEWREFSRRLADRAAKAQEFGGEHGRAIAAALLGVGIEAAAVARAILGDDPE